MAEKKKKKTSADLGVEQKLKFLYDLQCIDTEINKIKILRGELPLEIQDLEDELTGLSIRIDKLKAEALDLEQEVANKKNEILEAQTLIKKYEEQQNNVRNNREYDSLSKEIEFQNLEIQLCEKKIHEFIHEAEKKNENIAKSNQVLEERNSDLELKKKELDSIISETEAEEKKLEAKITKIEESVEERYLQAYHRIKENARNGLAVVTIQRNACGGCFNKIPPQRHADIRSHKKIIVCEYCGRILVDESLGEL